MRNKKILLLVFLMISIIITGTLAYFTVVTDRTALVLIMGEEDEVLVTLQPFEIKGTLVSTLDYNSLTNNPLDKNYIQITAENFGPESKEVYFYYRINTIDSKLVSGAVEYAITSSDTENGTYSEVKVGNFSTAVAGNDLVVYTFTIPAGEKIFYRVFTYLDGEQNVSGMAGATLEVEFRAEMKHIIVPDLDSGMIPVVIDNSGSTPVIKTIYANDEEWFDYENQKWANVVLVTEESRSGYQNTSGIAVTQSDILGYYVWIPRFEYRYDTLGTSYAGGSQASPRAIPINFIPAHRTVPSSASYKIHPAFVFGDKQVAGFWVGKFETTGTATAPTVLPGIVALNNQNQVSAFETSLKFNGGVLSDGNVSFSGSDYYGTTSGFDSHMMKNSEWGAVAYLSQSVYGACSSATSCSAVLWNDSNSYYTGMGYGGSGSLVPSANGSYDWYETLGQYSATNRNVTGVYDMSGGVWERMMSVLQYDSNFIYSGNASGVGGANSGFVGYIGDIFYDISGYVKLPPQKYYDRYTTTNTATACNGKVCYGHALSETAGWYNNVSSGFVSSSASWSMFGGVAGANSASSTGGIFSIGNSNGAGTSGVGFRSVIMSSTGI